MRVSSHIGTLLFTAAAGLFPLGICYGGEAPPIPIELSNFTIAYQMVYGGPGAMMLFDLKNGTLAYGSRGETADVLDGFDSVKTCGSVAGTYCFDRRVTDILPLALPSIKEVVDNSGISYKITRSKIKVKGNQKCEKFELHHNSDKQTYNYCPGVGITLIEFTNDKRDDKYILRSSLGLLAN